MRKLRHDAH
jgi:hypothetical protein